MGSFFIRRFVESLVLVWGILTLTFFFVHLAPGDPINLYMDPRIDPATIAQIRTNLGLDQPLHIQYLRYVGSLLRGDFGISFSKLRPVSEVLWSSLANTLQLTLLALLVDLSLGLLMGLVSAIRQYSLLDHTISLLALFVYSMPSFWLGLMLILLFALQLGWLPASQMNTPGAEWFGLWDTFWDRVVHLILPVATLGLASAAATGRFIRGSMLEVIAQDYIRVARAKGLQERVVLAKHALRNALLPVITLLGLRLPYLLGGAVIVETIFAWPGMGRLTVNAIFARDYPLIMAANLVAACTVVMGSFLADLLYVLADPRIRYD